jgi:DNA modification methylase
MEVDVILQGDCLEVLRTLPDNSVDSIVTDPPAGIEFLGKDWDSFKTGRLANYKGPPGGNVKPLGEGRGWQSMLPKISQSANRKCNACGQYKFSRTPCKCESPDWEPDSSVRDTFVAFMQAVFTEALRVLKPGGHAIVWAIPRTSHWTAWAIEAAGFEIRDAVYHCFATGFPKNFHVSKAIDATILTGGSSPSDLADAREAQGQATPADGEEHAYRPGDNKTGVFRNKPGTANEVPLVTDEAKRWEGWGTALKPAVEVWWLARKPVEQTVAKSVLAHGTGALNIDGCRVGSFQNTTPGGMSRYNATNAAQGYRPSDYAKEDPPADGAPGRWPTNLVMTHSPECIPTGDGGAVCAPECPLAVYDRQAGKVGLAAAQLPSFFFVPKPGRAEKEGGLEELPMKVIGTLGGGGEKANDPVSARFTKMARNTHPTPKPTTLMAHLVRLVTPPGGIVLDMFCGSGTTCLAAIEENMRFVGIEREDEYIAIAQARVQLAQELRKGQEAQRELFESALGGVQSDICNEQSAEIEGSAPPAPLPELPKPIDLYAFAMEDE